MELYNKASQAARLIRFSLQNHLKKKSQDQILNYYNFKNKNKQIEITKEYLESIILHTNITEIKKLILQLSKIKELYYSLHQNLREQLLTQLITLNIHHDLVKDFNKKNSLLLLEKAALYLDLLNQKEKSQVYFYAQKYEDDLRKAFIKHVNLLKFSEEDFIFTYAELLFRYENYEAAKKLLLQLPKVYKNYPNVFELLILIHEKKLQTPSQAQLISILNDESKWWKRLQEFEFHLIKCKNEGGLKYKFAFELNDLLKNPFLFLPTSSDAIAAFSEIIASHSDMAEILPNYFYFIDEHLTHFNFHDSKFRLFQGFLLCDYDYELAKNAKGKEPKNLYYYATGLIHRYLLSEENDENDFWIAKDIFDSKFKTNLLIGKKTFTEIIQNARDWVSKTPYYLEEKRRNILIFLAFFASREVNETEIKEYLNLYQKNNLKTLIHVNECCEKQNIYQLRPKIIEMIAWNTHYTNNQLKQLFDSSTIIKKYDLAWRCLTILSSRQALPKNAMKAWNVSGEKRASFKHGIFDESLIKTCLINFDQNSKKIIESLFYLGHSIVDLFHHLGFIYKTENKTPQNVILDQTPLNDLFSNIPSLRPIKKRFFLSPSFNQEFFNLIQFVKKTPQTTYGMYIFAIAENLAFTVWNFEIGLLKNICQQVIPQLSLQKHSPHYSLKLAKWLNNLNLHSKHYWYQLLGSLGNADIEIVQLSLYKFVCRLSLIIYPDHYSALKALQNMEADLEVLWDMEKFILSETYSIFREKIHLQSLVPIPSKLNIIY